MIDDFVICKWMYKKKIFVYIYVYIHIHMFMYAVLCANFNHEIYVR